LALATALALTVLVAGWWLITEPGRARARAAQAVAEAIQARGQVAAGRDAVVIVTASSARDAATDRHTQENRNAILAAPGASAPVDPGLGAAGRRAVCLRQSARRLPECQPLQPARP
jgi:type II secretory pathway component PulM